LALLLSTLVAIPSAAPVFALIRATSPRNFSNVQPNQAVLVGPECNGCLGMYPYLFSTSPSGRLVCVGWADANNINHNGCTVLSGSGQGAATNIYCYDMWINVDTVTISTSGQVTFYYN